MRYPRARNDRDANFTAKNVPKYDRGVFSAFAGEINGFRARTFFEKLDLAKRENSFMRDFRITSGQASGSQREIYMYNFCRESEARILMRRAHSLRTFGSRDRSTRIIETHSTRRVNKTRAYHYACRVSYFRDNNT